VFRRRAETLLKVPTIVEFVPQELRDSFSAPLPVQGMTEQVRAYAVSWVGDKNPNTEPLHPDVRHFMPVIELAVQAGGLLVSRKNLIQVKIRQDNVHSIGMESGEWHRDKNADGARYYDRRVVVSDVYGTQFETEDGTRMTTPDYGMLLFYEDTLHNAQCPLVETVRTRLQITQV
jgi:hypothetical protein